MRNILASIFLSILYSSQVAGIEMSAPTPGIYSCNFTDIDVQITNKGEIIFQIPRSSDTTFYYFDVPGPNIIDGFSTLRGMLEFSPQRPEHFRAFVVQQDSQSYVGTALLKVSSEDEISITIPTLDHPHLQFLSNYTSGLCVLNENWPSSHGPLP